MDSQSKGQEHGAAIRRVVSAAAGFGFNVAAEIVLDARRALGYVVGFGQGLLRERDRLPNA